MLSELASLCSQDVEVKEEGTRHILVLFNCRKDMAGNVDFSAANAKSSAQLRVKGDRKIFGKVLLLFVLELSDGLLQLRTFTHSANRLEVFYTGNLLHPDRLAE